MLSPIVSSADIERRATQIGRELLHAAREHRAGPLSARFWSDRLMQWTMQDPAFKVQLFRFIDVFPMLRTSAQVHDYLRDYLSQPGVTLPAGMELGLKAGRLAKGLMAKTIAGQITAIAQHFIAGTDVPSALPTLERLWNEGVAFSADLLGEACVSDVEARAYQQRYLDLVETLPAAVAAWPPQRLLESDHLGAVPRANISIKPSALCARTDAIDLEGTLDALTEVLQPILEAAARHQVLINFDMEQSALKDLTLALFERCCQAYNFPAGLALQAYLRSGMADAERIIGWTRRTGRQVTVRLIKGAYWDYEVIHAERMGWPTPVWTEKHQTDACFEQMAECLLRATPRGTGEGGVRLAVGSHNVRSIAYTLALLEKHDLPQSALEVQNLYGMADSLRAALGRQGVRVRCYVPLGEMIPGMAYLVRRLLENTSNQSWLRAGFVEELPDEVLLASPKVRSAALSKGMDTGEGPHPSPLPEGEGTKHPSVVSRK
jgi:RHH-type proline utilization regulon transcriptional repressor/proline dehydrogenase/delta 1-pyrroline-5-carboxylate dehydrogenase